MREYESREEREEAELDLKIIWKCDQCGKEREDYPGYNEGGMCLCGGNYEKIGEVYNA